MQKSDLEERFANNKDRYISEWSELLSFPSISTEIEHADDSMKCAEWLSEHLQKMGFKSSLLETSSQPVVFAERQGLPDKPVVLFYGHYDVQPVDPLELWDTDPFTPTMRDERLYARGAQDNKGQLFYVIKAIETLVAENALDCTVKIIIEGEEESGSRGIAQMLPKWKDLLKADILMVTDVGTVPSGAPTIIMSLRGLAYLTVSLSGPTRDMHSGMHGGCSPNPAQEMATLIASLHGPDGKIAIDGYYNDVSDPSPLEKELANADPFDDDLYLQQTGVLPLAGEKEFTPAERTGFRPSLDINGITSGYDGPGVKTIIPSRATAKITARLVPDQNPVRTLDMIIDHLKMHAPKGLRLEIHDPGCAGPGFRLDPNSELAHKAREVLDQLGEEKTAYLWEGASIPIIYELASTAGAEPLLAGFGAEEDNMHAPNESFSLDQFKKGFIYSALFLSNL